MSMSEAISRFNNARPVTVLVASVLGTVATLSVVWSIIDYRAWTHVEGGFPVTPKWWAISRYVKLTRKDPRSTGWLKELGQGTREVPDLPERDGPRPDMVNWPIPHRHIPQRISVDFQTRIQQHLRSKAAEYNMYVGTSVREGHKGVAVYSLLDGPNVKPSIAHDRLHTHSDHSVHVCLHPLDAAEVVDKGWGELFPLNGQKAAFGRLDEGLVLLYAPRSEDELEVILKIVNAGILYNLDMLKA